MGLELSVSKYVNNSFDKFRGLSSDKICGNIVMELVFSKYLFDAKESGEKNITNIINYSHIEDFEFNSLIYGDLRSKLDVLINNNREMLGGVFGYITNLDKLMIPENIVIDLIQSLKDIDFRDYVGQYRRLGNIFRDNLENIARRTFDDGLSPDSIRRLMSILIKDRGFKNLYNPAIGTGSVDIEIAMENGIEDLYGQDINPNSIRMCKMLLLVYGLGNNVKNIAEGDTLLEPLNVQDGQLKKFECIVSVLPFGLSIPINKEIQEDRFNRYKRGIPSKTGGELAFISHIIESLKDNGMAEILVSNGTLFRGGADQVIREGILKDNLIDAVILLPAKMLSHTAIATTLLVLNKNRDRDDILFIDLSNEVDKISKVTTVLYDETIKKVSHIYNNYLEVDMVSKLVKVSEVIDNESNLMVTRYVEKQERKELDLQEINASIKKLEGRLLEIHRKIDKYSR